MEIEKLKDLPNIKEQRNIVNASLLQLQNMKDSQNSSVYTQLKENYTKQKIAFDEEILMLQRQGELLLADGNVRLSEIKVRITLAEKELAELQLLKDNDPIDKKKYNGRITAKKRELTQLNKDAQKLNFTIQNLNQLLTLEEAKKTSIVKDLVSKVPFRKPEITRKQILVLAGIFLIMALVLVYFLFLKTDYHNYKVILPEEYADIRLGMSLEDFNELYVNKDFSEKGYNDGTTQVIFKVRKSSEYIHYNNWELNFDAEGYLMSMTGESTFNGEVEELCSFMENTIRMLQDAGCKKGLDWTYNDYPDCISKLEMWGDFKFKGQKHRFHIFLANDLNARYSYPLSIRIEADLAK